MFLDFVIHLPWWMLYGQSDFFSSSLLDLSAAHALLANYYEHHKWRNGSKTCICFATQRFVEESSATLMIVAMICPSDWSRSSSSAPACLEVTGSCHLLQVSSGYPCSCSVALGPWLRLCKILQTQCRVILVVSVSPPFGLLVSNKLDWSWTQTKFLPLAISASTQLFLCPRALLKGTGSGLEHGTLLV
jgi:hypothetical protein